MRLLNITTLRLEDAGELNRNAKNRGAKSNVPYAIISHVWMDPGLDYQNEVLMEELLDWGQCRIKKPAGAAKISGACKAARRWSKRRQDWEPESTAINHIWLDSCCIDQRNQAEVSMSINSMYRWYQEATVCLVHLSDFESSGGKTPDLSRCKWLTRGWTLQELVASRVVEFYDADWNSLGSKASLQSQLVSITKIGADILSHSKKVNDVSIAERMSWAGKRNTRIEEDGAYCLMGLFGVSMPTLYGEGKERAFRRLQEEIIKYSDDQSIFAWLDQSHVNRSRGLLAPGPGCFAETGMYHYIPSSGNTRPYLMTNKGLSIDLYLQRHPNEDKDIACLDCPVDENHYLGIFLKCEAPQAKQYVRIEPGKFCKVVASGRGNLQNIFVKQVFDI